MIFFNLLIFFTIIAGFLLIYILLSKKVTQTKPEDNLDLVQLTKENLETLHQVLHQFTEKFHQGLQKVIVESTKTSEQVKSLQNFTEEIKTIKNILSGPRERGFFGEVLLEEILNRLPSSMVVKQFSIAGFQRVDYALKVNEIVIPIDAKFPLDSYLQLAENPEAQKNLIRNLKERIKSIHQKYIQPTHGSVEFAILYLPNEGLYYELFQDLAYQEIWDCAKEYSVVIASPKVFEYLVSVLLLALKRSILKDELDSILQDLAQLEKEGKELTDKFTKAQKQLEYGLANLREFRSTLNRFLATLFGVLKLNKKGKEKSLLS